MKEIALFCFPYGAREIFDSSSSSRQQQQQEDYQQQKLQTRGHRPHHRHVRSLSGVRNYSAPSDSASSAELSLFRSGGRRNENEVNVNVNIGDDDDDDEYENSVFRSRLKQQQQQQLYSQKQGQQQQQRKNRTKDKEKLFEWDNVRHAHHFGFVITDEKKSELFASCLQFHVPVETVRKRRVRVEQQQHQQHGSSASMSSNFGSSITLSIPPTPRTAASAARVDNPFADGGNTEQHLDEVQEKSVQYRKRSLMIGPIEFTFDSARSNQAAIQRPKKAISPHGPSSAHFNFRSLDNTQHQLQEQQQVQYHTVYERVRVFQPIVMLLVSRLPIFTHCRTLLETMYHRYIAKCLPYRNDNSNNSNNDAGAQNLWIHGPGLEPELTQQKKCGEFYSGLQIYLTRFREQDAGTTSASSQSQVTLLQLLPTLYRELINLIFYTPMPPLGKVEVAFQFFNCTAGDNAIKSGSDTSSQEDELHRIGLPEVDDFAICDVPIHVLFECLGENNVVALVNHALLDSKIVLVSESLSILNICAEAVRKLMYPFLWQFTVITILPIDLIGMLEAPVPFMIGIHRSLLDMVNENMEESQKRSALQDDDDIPIVVDLDRNTISRPPLAPFPKKSADRLVDRLRRLWRPKHVVFDRISMHGESPHQSDLQIQERKTREMFLQFLCWIVGPVESFLHVRDGSEMSFGGSTRLSLDESAYLNSRPSEYRQFLSHFIKQTSFDEFKYSFEDCLIYKQLTAMETAHEISSFFQVKRESLTQRSTSYPITFHVPILSIDSNCHDSQTNDKDQVEQHAEHAEHTQTLETVGQQQQQQIDELLCPSQEKNIEQDALACVLSSIYALMHREKDPDIQARLYLMRTYLWERSHQPLKALQDLSCVNDVVPQLVKRQQIIQNLMKLQEHEIGFVIGMSDLVRGAFQQLDRVSPSVESVKNLLAEKERNDRESKRIVAQRDAGANWINRLANHRRSSIDFSSLFKSFYELLNKGSGHSGRDGGRGNITVSSSQFYVLATTSGLLTRSHTASIVYDALRDNDEERDVHHIDALNLFNKLEDVVDQNDKIASKLPLERHDIIIVYTTLCSDRRGSVGRLYLSLEEVYFGLGSQHVKVCKLSAVQEIRSVNRLPHQQQQQHRKTEVVLTESRGSPSGVTQELIVIVMDTGEEHEFRFTSDRDTYFVYLQELLRVNRDVSDLSPEEQLSRRREVGTLMLLEKTLHLIKKSVRQSLFDEENFSKRTKVHAHT